MLTVVNVRKGLRWYVARATRATRGTKADGQADLEPSTCVTAMEWRGGRLCVEGWAYLPRISVRRRRFNRVKVVLDGPMAWSPRARRTFCPQATETAPDAGHGYDWAGFAFAVRPWALRWRALVARFAGRKPEWAVRVVVSCGGASGEGPITGTLPGRAERPPGRELTPGRWIRPAHTSQGLIISLERVEQTGYTLAEDHLTFSTEITFRRRGTGQTHVGTQMPLALLDHDGADLVEWEGSALLRGLEGRFVRGRREIVVHRNRYDRLVVGSRTFRPVVDVVTWSDDGRLDIEGSYLDPDAGAREIVLRNESGQVHVVPMHRDAKRFTVRLTPTRMPRFGGTAPMESGLWDLAVRAKGTSRKVPIKFDHGFLDALPETPIVVDGRRHTLLSVRHDFPALKIDEDMPAEERGPDRQTRLRQRFYPAIRAQLTDAILLVSWNGQQYGDSLRPVYEEFRRRADTRERIWVVKDGAFAPPTGDRMVRAGSREHYEAAATCRYVVTNTFLPRWFRARPGQRCVQMWHGTPLKRIGFDMPWMTPRHDAWHRLSEEVPNWELLVSPSPWATPVLRRAFGYSGEVLECGYPRNDLLLSGDRPARANVVRRRLGVPEGRRIVLYAPTWRDDDRQRTALALDVDRARRALGQDHTLLVRGHLMQARPGLERADATVIDVTTYPDMAELLLVADVLVTDYSSSMFDFAPTGRPMLFFTYDLERYRDRTRGFYFDFEAAAPGPLLSTSEQVIDALLDVNWAVAPFAAKRTEFTARFCPLDDGRATARFVSGIWWNQEP